VGIYAYSQLFFKEMFRHDKKSLFNENPGGLNSKFWYMLLDSRFWNIKPYDTTGSSVTIEFSIIGLSRSQLQSKSCIHLTLPSYISNYPTGKWVSSTIYIPNTALYLAKCSGVQHTNNTQRHSDMSVVHFVMLECFCLRLPNRHPVFE